MKSRDSKKAGPVAQPIVQAQLGGERQFAQLEPPAAEPTTVSVEPALQRAKPLKHSFARVSPGQRRKADQVVSSPTLGADAPVPDRLGRLGHGFGTIGVGRRPIGSEKTDPRDGRDPANTSYRLQLSAHDGAIVQCYLNPLDVEDLIGADVEKGQLAGLISAYNSAEGKAEVKDFYAGGWIDYRSEVLTQQIERLKAIDKVIDDWLEKQEDDEGYNQTNMSRIKAGVERDRLSLKLDKDVPIRQGLVKGTYKPASNSVDLHVDAKGEGEGLRPTDMLIVARQLYSMMLRRSRLGGPDGHFILHPTGAAVVKTVSQLLGEALGDPKMVAIAHDAIRARKKKEFLLSKIPLYKPTPKSPDVLDQSVHDEHISYLRSLVGAAGVSITAVIPETKSMEEFLQNMVEESQKGEARLGRYLDVVLGGKRMVSLDVTIKQAQLPAVIGFLERA